MTQDGDELGAAGVMGNGHQNDSGGQTRHDLLREEELARLREEASRMVADGVMSLSDVSLNGRIEDAHQLADGENEAFREEVRAELDDVPQPEDSEEEQAEKGEGWAPPEVDFNTIWGEFGFGPGEPMSKTQLEEALAVSSHTAFRKGGARQAIDYALEAKPQRLIDCQVKADEELHGDAWVSGVKFKLPRGNE